MKMLALGLFLIAPAVLLVLAAIMGEDDENR
jgi:hypothetical protein